jgi:hypothetical protein
MNKRSSPGHNQKSMFFSLETVNEHRKFKRSAWKQIRGARLLELLSVPVIYACVVPLLLLDLSVAIYKSICIPMYGIPNVRRSDYLVFDRGRLAYLNAI